MNKGTNRLLVADDHTLFREGLRALFSATPGIEIVGDHKPATMARPSKKIDKNRAGYLPDVIGRRNGLHESQQVDPFLLDSIS